MKTNVSYENGVLVVTRVYAQARESVFDAWIQTSKTEQWWGCADTTRVHSEIEPKVGGKYSHVMTIKGTGTHPISGVLTQYDPPARLAYSMPGVNSDEKMQVSVEFIERDGATEVRLTQMLIPEPYGEIVTAGWTAAFNRLDRFFDGELRAA